VKTYSGKSRKCQERKTRAQISKGCSMAEQVHPQSSCSTWVIHTGAEKRSKKEGAREEKSKEQVAAEGNRCALTTTCCTAGHLT